MYGLSLILGFTHYLCHEFGASHDCCQLPPSLQAVHLSTSRQRRPAAPCCFLAQVKLIEASFHCKDMDATG
eukprot:9083974-Alexandrium_andersonii.AAC.1